MLCSVFVSPSVPVQALWTDRRAKSEAPQHWARDRSRETFHAKCRSLRRGSRDVTLTPSINNCLYPGYGRRPAPVRPSNWTDGLGLGSPSAVRPSVRPTDEHTDAMASSCCDGFNLILLTHLGSNASSPMLWLRLDLLLMLWLCP
jgi:hypothetical protein